MALKSNKGIAVDIQHIPEDSEGDVLRIGMDLWNTLFPNSAREGPVAVSVGLLQSHTGTEKRGTSFSPSVICWAVPSKDVQVSYKLRVANRPQTRTPDNSTRHSSGLEKAIPSHFHTRSFI